jgi:hypothetical protein
VHETRAIQRGRSVASATRRTTVETVLERLLRQAYLFDDPLAYEAGVRDAIAELVAASGSAGVTEGSRQVA